MKYIVTLQIFLQKLREKWHIFFLSSQKSREMRAYYYTPLAAFRRLNNIFRVDIYVHVHFVTIIIVKNRDKK